MIALLVALAAAPSPEAIAFIDSYMTQSRVPGIVVRYQIGNDPAEIIERGYANIEEKTPVKANMIFDAGSISKMFTCVVTLKQVELGKLKLSDNLGKYVDSVPAEWQEVTVRQMLSHTSGLPEYVLYPGIMLMDDFETPKWFETMADKPLDFKPGSEFDYSNTNFFMLKLVNEKASGSTFDSLLKQFVFEPAEMMSTGRLEQLETKVRPIGYWIDQEIQEIGPAGKSPDDGSGSHFSTVYDLARFSDALFGGKLLSQESLKLMTTPAELPKGRKAPYGLGLFIRESNGIRIWSHGGNSVGYAGSLTYIPSKKATITLLGNAYQMGGDSVALGLARRLFPELTPKAPALQDDPDSEQSKRLIDTLTQLAKGELSGELISEELRARYSRPRGQMSLGALASFTDAEYSGFYGSEPSGPDTIRRVGFKVGERELIATFTIDSEGKIFTVSVSAAPSRI